MSEPLSLRSRVMVAPEHVTCDVAGESLILSLKDGVYYGLDPVSAWIWELLKDAHTVEQLRDRMVERYEIEVERCEGDLFELLDQMREWNLIEVLDARGA